VIVVLGSVRSVRLEQVNVVDQRSSIQRARSRDSEYYTTKYLTSRDSISKLLNAALPLLGGYFEQLLPQLACAVSSAMTAAPTR
jgi:hypothetical protein